MILYFFSPKFWRRKKNHKIILQPISFESYLQEIYNHGVHTFWNQKCWFQTVRAGVMCSCDEPYNQFLAHFVNNSVRKTSPVSVRLKSICECCDAGFGYSSNARDCVMVFVPVVNVIFTSSTSIVASVWQRFKFGTSHWFCSPQCIDLHSLIHSPLTCRCWSKCCGCWIHCSQSSSCFIPDWRPCAAAIRWYFQFNIVIGSSISRGGNIEIDYKALS